MQEFVTDHSKLMRAHMNGKFVRKALELKLIGSQFSAIVEVRHTYVCVVYSHTSFTMHIYIIIKILFYHACIIIKILLCDSK